MSYSPTPPLALTAEPAAPRDMPPDTTMDADAPHPRDTIFNLYALAFPERIPTILDEDEMLRA